MPAKPVQISLDQSLLDRIDADAEARAEGRSAFIRAAVERYLAEKTRRRTEAQIANAYARRADALAEEANDFVRVQAWPDE